MFAVSTRTARSLDLVSDASPAGSEWRRPAPTARQHRTDLLVALALAAGAIASVLLARAADIDVGRTPPAPAEEIAWCLAVSLPLAFRRRAPLAVLDRRLCRLHRPAGPLRRGVAALEHLPVPRALHRRRLGRGPHAVTRRAARRRRRHVRLARLLALGDGLVAAARGEGRRPPPVAGHGRHHLGGGAERPLLRGGLVLRRPRLAAGPAAGAAGGAHGGARARA